MMLIGDYGIRAYKGTPAFRVDFLQGSLDSRLTFTRASSAWYYTSAGVLTQAMTNTPRFDYNPSTLALNGLLIEQQGTNLVLQSGSIGTSPWYFGNASRTGTVASPDGGINGSQITPTAQNGGANLSVSGVSGNTTYTMSCWIWVASGTRSLVMQYYDGTNYNSLTVTATTTPTRFSKTFTTVASPASSTFSIQDNNAGGFVPYNVWGAQLEVNSFATSYIPTSTTTVTRASDNLSKSSIGGWFNASHGTMFTEVMLEGLQANQTWALLDDGTDNNILRHSSYSGAAIATVVASGSVVWNPNLTGVTITANTIFKNGFSYAAANFNSTVNGGTITSQASGALPTGINTLHLGTNLAANSYLCGWLRSYSYYNTQLTNTQLQAISGQL